jgi:hypothetical protein
LAGTGIRRNPEESGGIWRNLEESGGIRCKCMNSCPARIPAKNPVKVARNRNSRDPLQNHVSVKNSSGKHREKKKSSGILFFTVFEPQK